MPPIRRILFAVKEPEAACDAASMKSLSTSQVVPPHYTMEHRWGVRRPCRARVCLSCGGGVTGTGTLRDVSISGAFLETALSLPLFCQVAIVAHHDDDPEHVAEVNAAVVRREGDGVGIEWCEAVTGSICARLGCTLRCGAHADRSTDAVSR